MEDGLPSGEGGKTLQDRLMRVWGAATVWVRVGGAAGPPPRGPAAQGGVWILF